jgi:Ca2+-binding EF-hand superfamily protein
MMRRRKSTGEYDTELQQVFNVNYLNINLKIKFLFFFCRKKVFDKNKDGFIDKDELYDMLSRLGDNITEVSYHQTCKSSIIYF